MADPFLQLLQSAMNKTGRDSQAGGDGLAITLVCGGTMLSGELISSAQLAREMAKVCGESELARTFSDTADAWGSPDQDEPPVEEIEHVHVGNASFIQGGQEMKGTVAWRARVDEIDGWTIGNLGLSRS